MGDDKKDKGKSKSGGGRGRLSSLALIGFVLFLVSWFVPVAKGQEWLGGLARVTKELGGKADPELAAVQAPDWLPGWGACQIAWNLLIDDDPEGPDGKAWKQRVLGATCLSNAVMVLAILGALMRARAGFLGFVLLGCAWLNASWIYLFDDDPFAKWGAGYWLWLASFVLAGIGLMLPRRG
jgi:hypothetical protein